MKTRRTILCGLFAVIFTLTLALATIACEGPTDDGGTPGTTPGTTPGGNTPTAPAITATSLPDGIEGTVYSQTLTATGTAPITWSLESGGALPAGLTLSGTGNISGTPTTEGTYTFTVKAANAAGSATQALSITVLPAYAALYGKWVSTTGQYQPYTLTITAGTIRIEDKDGDFVQYADVQWGAETENTNAANKTNYPNGFTFTGTRTNDYYSTTFGFVALSADGQSVYVGTNASIASNIDNAGPIYTKAAPTITTASLPPGAVGAAYSQTLAATNPPVTWSLVSGALPTGLTLAANGAITGTPTAEGTSAFTVKAANAAGSDTKSFSITVLPAGSNTDPKAGLYGAWRSTTGDYQPFTLTITEDTIRWETGTGGHFVQYDDVVWTAAANANTANKTNYPNGFTFTGTRTASASISSTVILGFVALSADGKSVYLGENASRTFNVSGSGAIYTKMSPIITTTSLPYGILGTAYSQTLAATGSSITWTLASGALPAGLELSTSGVISGTPTTDGQFTFTVNAANDVGSRTQSLTIAVAIPLTENQWADGNIPTTGGEQWFTFTATASEQYIHAAFGTLTDLYVQVYTSSGATSGSETNMFSSTTYISRTLSAGQTYYIRVRPYGTNSTNSSGTYWIGFNTSTTAPNVQVPANAIPLTENQWADGNLPTSSDVQWFSFTATASNQYLHAAFGTLTRLYVHVYTSGGAEVGSQTYSYGDSTLSTSRTLESGQAYYIRVVPYDSSYSGTYQIAFNTSTTAPNFQVPTNAIPLTVNVWADGSIPTGGQQWFVFTATASPQYIHFAPTGTLTAVYVQVYDSSSGAVGSETNLYGSTLSTSRTLESGQTYYIRVRPYGSGGGTYRIAFNTSTTAPIPTDAIPLTENQWANSNIPTVGGVQWFTFTATAATQYIHFDTAGTLSNVYVQVYNSSGSTVESETRMYSSTLSTSRTLESGQTYYIRVRPNTNITIGGSYGTYRIVFNTSTTPPFPTSAKPLIAANQWAWGDIPSSGDRYQWFSFTATASTQYIHFDPSYGTLSRVYVQVYASNGTTTVGNEANLDSSTTRTSRTLTSGQTYYIRVRPYGSSYSGDYRIAFNTSSTAPN